MPGQLDLLDEGLLDPDLSDDFPDLASEEVLLEADEGLSLAASFLYCLLR